MAISLPTIPRTVGFTLALLGHFALHAPDAHAFEHGFYARVSGEASALSRPLHHEFSAQREGAAVSANVERRETTTIFGGRLEAAYLFLPRPHLAVGPRLSFSYSPMSRLSYDLTTDVATYRVQTDPSFWSAAVGVEVQLLERMLLITPEAGVATLSEHGTFAGAGLEGSFSSNYQRPFGRVGIGARFPVIGPVSAGVLGAGELLLPPEIFAAAAARASLLVFVDLDFHRFP